MMGDGIYCQDLPGYKLVRPKQNQIDYKTRLEFFMTSEEMADMELVLA